MEKSTLQLMIVGIMDVIIAICGILIWLALENRGSILAMTATVIAFATFFGFVAISQSQDVGWAANVGSMRTAITAGVLALYFFILPISIFLKQNTEMSAFGQTMVQTFTTTMSIIIPFYFGASVYAQVHAPGTSQGDGQDNTSGPSP